MIKSDFELINRKIPTDKDVKVYAIGDVHVGSIESNIKAWEQFNKDVLSDPQAYIIFIGDMMNNATKNSVSSVFEDTMRPRDQKIYLRDKLEPLAKAGKILAMVPGNHENRSLKDADDNPMYDIAAKLDLEDIYRENVALIKLSVGQAKNIHPNVYTILATHGAGGGMLTGGSVNRYERFAANWDGVDIFYFGHTHKPFITKPGKIVFDRVKNTVRNQSMIIMTVPSWLQYGGYSLRKMMSPTSQFDPEQPMFTTFAYKRRKWGIKTNW